METFILWGVGLHSQSILKKRCVPLSCIETVIDNNPRLHGDTFCGIRICNPDVLKNEKWKSNLIVVGTDKYFDEVKAQIMAMKINKEITLIDEFVEKFPEKDEVTTTVLNNLIINKDAEYILKKVSEAGSISQHNLKNARVLANRNEAVKLMPKGMVVGEVGVAYGDFSEYMIKTMQPSKFYAIDYFNKENPYISFWGRNDFEETGLTHEEWYKNRFKDLIDSKKMYVCQGLSWECLDKFEDNYFDYLYIDACHDYESTSKDISASIRKVKKGGIIQFNDYTLWDIEGKTYYGVVPAVNRMIADTNSEVLYFCLSPTGYYDIVVKLNK